MNHTPGPLTLDQLDGLLVDPGDTNELLQRDVGGFINQRTGVVYPLRPQGFVDFVTPEASAPAIDAPRISGILARLNEIYNRHLEQRISASVFAAGGMAAVFAKRTLRSWLGSVRGLVIDVGCGDRKAESWLGSDCTYLGVDFLPVTQFSPWREAYPHINADALHLPLRSESADCVLNVAVLEHVTSPERLVREMSRVLRPGGTLIVLGPGDILLSHGEPHNYFNMTRFAYRMLFEQHGLVIEEEYYPSRFWMSLARLCHDYIVRNGWYDESPIRKLLQLPVLGLSLVLSPPANLVALALDSLLPFDNRGYSLLMIRAHKLPRTGTAR